MSLIQKAFHAALLLAAVALFFSVVFYQTKAEASEEFRVFNGVESESSYAAFVPGEVIVRYENDNRPFRVERVRSGRSVSQALAELRRNPNVVYAEPNFIATASALPNDPYYQPFQWNFDNPTYGGVHAEAAWDITRGAGVTVAVIDTGVAYEDYTAGSGRFKKSYYQAPDLSGTCFVPGYDFINNDSHANDDNAHGTHVAGTIAQTTNNGSGVAGLAYETCLMPVKALDQNGSGSYSAIANAIYFAADNGAHVINMSLGGPSDSQTLRDAVAYAYNKGVTILAASGNDNSSTIGYPAAYDEYVIAVGATRFDEARAPYSNYGSSLDFVAPGGDTNVDQNSDGYVDGVLQQTFNPTTKKTSEFGYWFFQGTSMATPHAAAAAAMVIANGNATTPDNVRLALQTSADDLGAAGRDNTFGHGLINVPAALAWTSSPVEPVDAVPSVTLTTPSNGATVSGNVLITADAADDNGVSEVRFYAAGSFITTDTTSPYEANWDSTSVSDGVVILSAVAIDTIGQSASTSVSVTIDNVNETPTANAGPNQSGYVSGSIAFDGSASNDDRGIASYAWDFGDGAVATGITTTHAYNATGTYTVMLMVTDSDGLTASDQALVTITEVPVEATKAAVFEVGYLTEGGRNNDRHLAIIPRALNDFGNPVGSAALSLTLIRNTGGIWSFSGTTGSDGMVRFDLKNSSSGCYSATITALRADGLTWDGTTPTNQFCKN